MPAPHSITTRQENSAIHDSVFLRRAYHSSTVLGKRVYIGGGECSYSSGGRTVHQPSDALVSIDLSEDWNNVSVALHATFGSSGAGALKNGGIWVDEKKDTLYTGFAGISSSFGDGVTSAQGLWSSSPDTSGGGLWQSLNGSTDESFTTRPRAFGGQVASGDGSGYFLGGMQPYSRLVDNGSSHPDPVRGLVSYNFSTKKLRSMAVSGVSTEGNEQNGGMLYVPNFGDHGILVAMGGEQMSGPDNNSRNLIPFTNVRVFNPISNEWFEQRTSGSIPKPRKEFCIAGTASNNHTYEILVYAGWDGTLGLTALPYDEAFVLTLPGFHWTKANYLALHPRHGLTCNAVGGGQILTIGGVDTMQKGSYSAAFDTPDPFTQGLAIFDLISLTWRDSYSVNPDSYTPAPEVHAYYKTNGRSPTAGFTSPALESLFAIEYFTAPGNSNEPEHGNIRALIGGIVGSVVGVLFAAFLVFCCWRRRVRRRYQETYFPKLPTLASMRNPSPKRQRQRRLPPPGNWSGWPAAPGASWEKGGKKHTGGLQEPTAWDGKGGGIMYYHYRPKRFYRRFLPERVQKCFFADGL
ncbi:hypothetical protein B0H67DRAFT_534076 [Lasiosphaeris hirsuta]|uniref:Kelch repeat protein n=1 Tax=Lasiosphaeris hirsuta TaxID=260670 RepID=A0AA40AQ63_9PEZI|nr:hypothetical protein B0H67DRAFT_534076 [Lasiosphaeris hirsuta]